MSDDEESIGTHRVRVIGDTVLIRYIGVPELEHIQAIHRRLEQVIATHGRLFAINDMRRSGLLSAETRQWIATWGQTYPVTAVVNFGASLPIRALQTLMIRAAVMLGARMPSQPVYCATEAEAFAWVEARRRQLDARST